MAAIMDYVGKDSTQFPDPGIGSVHAQAALCRLDGLQTEVCIASHVYRIAKTDSTRCGL